MNDPAEVPPRQAPAAPRQRRSGLLWATGLALVAFAGYAATHSVLRPETGRYRLERIDRGPIRSEVTATGTVSPFAPTLFTIAGDLSRIQVQASVGEGDIDGVAVGETATFRLQAYADRVFTGTVSEVRLTPRVIPGVVHYTVLVDADNRDHQLLPGMTATVSIEVARRDDVLRLPLPALSFVPPGMEPAAPPTPHVGRVFVLDHGRPRPVRVTVGLQDRRQTELVAGPLREGDAVIVEQYGVARPAPGALRAGSPPGPGGPASSPGGS